MLDVSDGVADEPERVQDFGDCETHDGGPHRNDQAEADRIVVGGAGPAAVRGRPRDDALSDAQNAATPKIPNTVAMKAGGMSEVPSSPDRSTSGLSSAEPHSPSQRFSAISAVRWPPGYRDGIGKSRRHFGRDRCRSGAGDRVRVRADRKAGKTSSKGGTAGTTGSPPGARRQGTGGARCAAAVEATGQWLLAEPPGHPHLPLNGDVDA